MRSIGIRVALLIALVSPIALWLVAAQSRGALAGGGPVLAASLASFLSIGVQSMVMSARRIPEASRGDVGLFGACLAFFGGCMVSAVVENGGALPPVWVHLIPPIAIGALWAGFSRPGSIVRPLDQMLSALESASDKEPVATRIVEHLSQLGETEETVVQATTLLIVVRPLVIAGFERKVERLMGELDLAGCPAPLRVLLAYELVLSRLRLGNPAGAREALASFSCGSSESDHRLAAGAAARVAAADGDADKALAGLTSHASLHGHSPEQVDVLNEHADSALHAAFAVAHATGGDTMQARRSLARLGLRGGRDELRYLATGNTAVAESAAELLESETTSAES